MIHSKIKAGQEMLTGFFMFSGVQIQLVKKTTVLGDWPVIFRFDGEDVELVDYLDYH